jgi:hypothetical protein
MEAVFAQLVLLGDFEVDRVRVDMRWDRGVETGVEVGDIRSVWQERRDGFDDCKCWRVVSKIVITSMKKNQICYSQWCQITQFLNLVVCLLVNYLTFIVSTSMHNTMT